MDSLYGSSFSCLNIKPDDTFLLHSMLEVFIKTGCGFIDTGKYLVGISPKGMGLVSVNYIVDQCLNLILYRNLI